MRCVRRHVLRRANRRVGASQRRVVGARRDADGYYWITGRVDDVLNVSGHRLGTAEIESALREGIYCFNVESEAEIAELVAAGAVSDG